MLLNSRTISW